METIEELKRENNNLSQQLKVAMQKLSVFESEDLEKEGYYALKGYLKQQIDIVKNFKISEEITKNPKDDKYYDRVKALGEGLKSMITDLNTLKIELKINPKEESKRQRTSPESVAASIGNTAGQNM